MLFNSIPFLLLFILTYSIYWNVNNRLKKHVLLISSVVFYSYFSLAVTVHFLLVIFVNFLLTQKLFEYKSRNKETLGLIRLIVILNLINLFLFKYFYFFMDSFYFITRNPFFKETGMTVSIVLPLAISFYTFQLIALQVDVHRDKLKTPISMQDYFIFIIFFPQLIAGPIMRTEDFLPQLNNPKINADSVHRGLMLLMSGLFKKVVIADNISPIIAPLYHDPSKFDSLSLAIGCLAFMSQVYCDFSGYTDMARGLAKLTGFEIPENFHGPLLSPSFRDLWARWHITLSTWLRDYLYIPLGGNKRGFFWSNLNMMITMSLGGLWHGANITYLLWGAFLGAMLWIERILEKQGFKPVSDNRFAKFFKTIFVVSSFALSGVFFRTGIAGQNSISLSIDYYKQLFTFSGGIALPRLEELFLFISLTFLFNYLQVKSWKDFKFSGIKEIILPGFAFCMLLLLGLFGDGGGDFIYFQF